ncbi:unknown [Salmonella phage FelixO1]|uniref:Uncharacterized protein n=1 Tax=Salmonella phage Felix O1 (isolate Felix O1-VT1) TaxID=1283336 RepID=Q6KGA8_BPFO1|nr:unknown [Salmonella phage FelixO1]
MTRNSQEKIVTTAYQFWQKTVTNCLKSLLSLRKIQKAGIKSLLKQLMQTTSKRSLVVSHLLKQTLTTS